jgi:serine protease Do
MDGPAEVAGIQGEDIIVRVNDHKVANTTDLINFVSELEPGSQGTIDVWRDGKMLTLDIAIGKFPGRSAARFGKDYLGMHVTEMRELSAEVLEQFELEEQPSDFYVVEVVPGSPAEEAGIRTEDIVLEVAHQEVESLEHFKALIGEHARPGKTLLLRVMRLQTGDESRKVYVKVPDEYEAN